MGTTCSSGNEINKPKVPTITHQIKTKGDFDLIRIIGKGGFGCVWKVVDKRTNKFYALKIMDKAKIIMKKSVKSIQNERKIL
jgi:serine/threonine protein kinase